MRTLFLSCLWAAVSSLYLWGCGCGSRSPGGSTGLDCGLDSSMEASAPADASMDGSMDGSGRPQGIQHDYCHQTRFKLPPTSEDISGFVSLSNGRVTYSMRPDPKDTVHSFDLYLFDLLTCTEYVVAGHVGTQVGSIWQDTIVWADERWSTSQQFNTELVSLDIPTWTETRLTFSLDAAEAHPRTNGRHLVFWDSDGAPPEGYYGLTLWDTLTNERTRLAEWDLGPTNHYIGQRYVAFAAGHPLGSYKDVYYHDILTRTTHHIESTGPGQQEFVRAWEGTIVWEEEKDCRFEVVVYDIETGQEMRPIDDEYDETRPGIWQNLLIYNTYRYSGMSWCGGPYNYRDVCIHDLDTGYGRRITEESGYWWPLAVDPPWLVYSMGFGPQKEEYYVINLVQAGMLDQDGHVIPEASP